MHDFRATPSLLMFKTSADALRSAALGHCPAARARFEKSGHDGFTAPTHVTCLSLLAKEYGYESLDDLIRIQKLILKYCKINLSAKIWKNDFQKKWNRNVFERQYAALITAAKRRIPLSTSAELHNINFRGFHFSGLLMNRLHSDLDTSPEFDFRKLDASGSYIEASWAHSVSSFAEAKLQQSKFYRVYVDPAVSPGIDVFERDFSETDLRDADLRGAYLRGSNFRGAVLENTDLRNANLADCCFTGVSGVYRAGNDAAWREWSVSTEGRYRV